MNNFKNKKKKLTQNNYKKNRVFWGINRKLHESVFPSVFLSDCSLISNLNSENHGVNKKLFIVGCTERLNLSKPGHQMSSNNKRRLPYVEHKFCKTGLILIRKIITSKKFSPILSLEKKQTVQSQRQQSLKNKVDARTQHQRCFDQLNNKTQNHTIEEKMSQAKANNQTRTNVFRKTNSSKIGCGETRTQLGLSPHSVQGPSPDKFGPKIVTYVQSQNYKINQKTNVFLNKTYQKIPKQKEKTNITPLTNLFPVLVKKNLKNYFKNNVSLKNFKKNIEVTTSLTYVKNQKNLVFGQEQLNTNNLKLKKHTTNVFQSSYSKMMEINLLTISLASANRIRQWAEKTLPNGKVVGEVINPETVHYKTLKPIKGGLFCERIFGPLKDHECACGKKFNIKNYLSKVTKKESPLIDNNLVNKLQKRYFCRVCDVEYTYSIIRRTQLGFIQLASPTTHVWFVKGIPSYIGILLDLKKKHLQNITYNTAILTLEHAFRGRQFLPTSPSSIFESWQKIMKTHYPDKYISNTDTPSDAKATNIFTNNKSLRNNQSMRSKKSNKKEMISNTITKKNGNNTSTNCKLLLSCTSKNWRKNQKLLYQQNRKNFYFKNNNTHPLSFESPIGLWPNYLKSNYLRHSVNKAQQGSLSKIKTNFEFDLDNNLAPFYFQLQNKELGKLISKQKMKKKGNKTTLGRFQQSAFINKSIFNKKGWFKLTHNLLTKKNIYVKKDCFVTRLQFNNIYVSTQDDFQLLTTLLVKNFDWRIHFLTKAQLGDSCCSRQELLQDKFRPRPLTYIHFNNLAFFHKQQWSVLEKTPDLTKVQNNVYKFLHYHLKINPKKLFIYKKIGKAAIPLYLLYFSKNQVFLKVLRTKLVSGAYNIFLPIVESNLVYRKHSNGRESSNKKTNNILFIKSEQKRKKINFLLSKNIDLSSPKQFNSTKQKIIKQLNNIENTKCFIPKTCGLIFNIPFFFSQQILTHILLKLSKLFIKKNQTTICFLEGTVTTKNGSVNPFLYLEHNFFSKDKNFVNYFVGSLEMLKSFTGYFLQNKLFSFLKRKPNTVHAFFDLIVNLNVFTKYFLKSLVSFTNITLLTKGLKNHSLKNTVQNKKNFSTFFILTNSLKEPNFKFLEKHTTKLAIMLSLNLTNQIMLKSRDKFISPFYVELTNKTEKIQKSHTYATSVSCAFNFLKHPIKTKIVQRLHSCYIFNQGLQLIKKARKMTKNRIWKKQTKIQFVLRQILQQRISRIREVEPLMALRPALNFLKIVDLTTKNQNVSESVVIINNVVKKKNNGTIKKLNELRCHVSPVIYKTLYALKYFSSLKMLKILTFYFFFFKPSKKRILYEFYSSFIADFEKMRNKSLRNLFVLKTFFTYKIKYSKLAVNMKTKTNHLYFSLIDLKLDVTKNFKNKFTQAKDCNSIGIILLQKAHNYCWRNKSTSIFKNLLAKTKKLAESIIINNIYCLSHRELWEQEKDWQDFSYYYYSPTNLTDIPIPLYRHRNYDLLFGIDNTLTLTAVDNVLAQTRIYNLGININTSFSGAGLIQKLLNEFNYSELKKMDKQNRILLFEYNKHIKKLKKKMNSGVIKSRHEYYKACHIRDVLIRRTKLTRKIFNKIFNTYTNLENNPGSALTKQKPSDVSSEVQTNRVMLSTRSKQVSQTIETNGLNMILTLLPVLPPVLRPVLKMAGQFTISDLNRLYQRIIYRNERLKKFLKDPALSSSFEMKYAQRLLQEAVDNLIQNGKSGVVPEKDARGRLLKSLSDILKGKQGRFRQYLLGKRVDYSGRSVIVVGPRLKLHECGIPKEMALVLYSPFLIKRILNEKLADTYLAAKKLIKTNPLLVSQLLREIMKSCPVLLNRAPTLHRLGFQAFQPKLVDGKAILLHPLVCPAFNADFDGDQMAVHVPITFEARAEAWKLMLARNNLLSPATGDPIMLPSQDMVLGCYYLTTNCSEKWSKSKKGSGMYFHNINDVFKTYYQQLIHLHAIIWVNITGHVENANILEQPLEIRIPLVQFKLNKYVKELKNAQSDLGDTVNQRGFYEFKQNLNYIEIYSKSHNILNFNTMILNQIIRTTPGKILFNMILKNAIEKRPVLLSKYNYKTGLIKNKLINSFNLETTNFSQ
nr:beta' subunit of RNA polymerase [Eudorina elegans]